MSPRAARLKFTPTTRRRPWPAPARSRSNGRRTSPGSAFPRSTRSLVAVGGGGLVSGVAAWFAGRVKVVGVEPEGSRALDAALQAGAPVDVPVQSVAADSLGARRVGALNLAIAQAFVARIALVPDAAIVEAQRRLWRDVAIVAEPGGAAAFAALLSGAYRPEKGERVGVLVCGANVDLAAFAALA